MLEFKVILEKIFNNIKLDCWIIEGKESNSKEDLIIFYAGSKYGKNYFCKIAYDGVYEEKYLGKNWLWDLSRLNAKPEYNSSLIIIESFYCLLGFIADKGFFVIPSWVSAIVDITAKNPIFKKNKSLKNDIRRINKNKISFQLTHDRAQFDNFYYNMYKPYIEKIHGDRAIIDNYQEVSNKFGIRHYCLGLIKREGEVAGGNLFFTSGKSLSIRHIGVKDGNSDYVKKGIIQAMFYFCIKNFQQKGFKKVNLGLCRPHLNDGVLRFKKKWSPDITCKKWTEKVFLIKNLTVNPATKSFFVHNPFVFIEKRHLNAAIFCDSFSMQNLDKIYKYYNFKRLSELRIWQFKEGFLMRNVATLKLVQ